MEYKGFIIQARLVSKAAWDDATESYTTGRQVHAYQVIKPSAEYIFGLYTSIKRAKAAIDKQGDQWTQSVGTSTVPAVTTKEASLPDRIILQVDYVLKGVTCTGINYSVRSEEAAFEQLTQLSANGCYLESAVLIDKGKRTTLPVAAFDSQPIGVHLERLQQELHQVMACKPVVPPMTGSHSNLKGWFLQLDTYYTKQLSCIEGVTVCLTITLKKVASRPSQSIQEAILIRYHYRLKQMLTLNQTVREAQQRNRQRLERL